MEGQKHGRRGTKREEEATATTGGRLLQEVRRISFLTHRFGSHGRGLLHYGWLPLSGTRGATRGEREEPHPRAARRRHPENPQRGVTDEAGR